MKITIVGTGYVGLVAGACFADSGYEVICVDSDPKKVATLAVGVCPIYEPGLETLIKNNISENRLSFSTSLKDALKHSSLVFLAVGTPAKADGSSDLSYLYSAVDDIIKNSKNSLLLGIKSTVPVGTGDKIQKYVSEKSKSRIRVFSNPEFLKEGDAVSDFLKPDRIILGIEDESLKPILSDLYSPFFRKSDRIFWMNRKAAELTKYAANAMLATRISFMNQLSLVCDQIGANINDVRKGIGSDPRIGPDFLYPGMGYGGSCFPKDILALKNLGKELGLHLGIIEGVHAANELQKKIIFQKIKNHFTPAQLAKATIAVWGLSFKAKTDDIRESPAIELVQQLLKNKVKVQAFDPKAMPHVQTLLGNKITLCKSSMACLQKADALVIAADWNEFRRPDFEVLSKLMKQKIIFDGKNLLNRKQVEDAGFIYYGIGV